MTVSLSGRRGLPRLDRQKLRRRAGAILRALDCDDAELSILLVGDEEIAALNGEYRGKPRPTDVLSFSLLEGRHSDHRGALLGDVVISLETAERQARRGRRSLPEETLRLLVHGVLHLLGHDHEVDAEARAMRREERRLLREVVW